MKNDLKFKIFLILISVFSFSPSVYAATCGAGSDANVSELQGYTQIYQLDIPSNANYGTNTPVYGIDNSATTIDNGIARIGYYLELQKDGSCETEWVWVSMNAFTQNLGEIGVPVSSTGVTWQQSIDNMNVESNVAGVVTGTDISTGNIEFWHHCYTRENDTFVLNASDDVFDFGDSLRADRTSCHGSMQVHNYSEAQTLFAFNAWDSNRIDSIGIGNNTGGNPDWTFADNIDDYTLRSIEVWVQPQNLAVLDLNANGGINPDTGNAWQVGDVDQVYEVARYASSTQDASGNITITDANLSLFIEGNLWQKINFPYTVTENTVIEFDFQSTEQGEIHAIGFDDDLSQSEDRTFMLYGTQSWGISDFDNYSGSGVTHYTIPVGQFYTGNFDHLFFINDDDDNPTRNSTFSNIVVYEASNIDPEIGQGCDANTGLLNAVGIKINNAGTDVQIDNSTEALAIHAAWLAAGSPSTGLIDNEKYNVSASGSSTVERIDFGGSEHDFTGTLAYPGNSNGVNGSNFVVYTSGILSLPAGDYTIYVESDDGFSFVMDTIAGDSVSFNKFGSSNSGDANELRFEEPTGNSNTGGSFTLSQYSSFDIAAMFFERGGGDYLEISITNDIRTSAAPSGYEILSAGALSGKVQFGGCLIDHYEIIHDGQGLTCAVEPVTIKACMNSDCSTLSSDEITLDLQATNTSTTTTKKSVTFIGSTELVGVNFSHTFAETLSLSLANATVIATEPLVCDDSSGTSCNIAFSDTGFIFGNNNNSSPIIPTQLSGKPSDTGFNAENLFIQAVRTDDNTGSCTGVFPDGGDVPINLSYTCHGDSSACTSNLELTNNATPKSITTNVTEQSLRFDSNSTAYFTLNYPDAGKLTINAQKDIDVDGLGDIKSFNSSSNAFVVRPFGVQLDFSQDTNSANALASSTSESDFKKAGETFSLRAIAKQWAAGQDVDNDGVPDDFSDLSGNSTANNFDNEQLSVTRTLFLPDPTTANIGVLTTETSNTFNGSILDNNYNFSEVGIIHLSASLTDSDYIGGGDIQGYIANVGRFTPAYFIQTVESHGSLNGNHGPDAACIINDWAYSGQETDSDGSIRYDSLSAPKALITPYNTAGTITENYTASGFMKLEAGDISVDLPTEDFEQPRIAPDVIDEKVNIAAQLSEGDLSATADAGVLNYEFNSTDNFIYEHNQHSLYAPFPAKIPFIISQIEDEDGINLYDGSDTAIIATELILTEGVEVRFGRWRIENGFGPETSNLLMPMSIEEYNGTSFITNSDESCISGTLGNKFTSGTVGSGGLSLWDYRLVDTNTSDNLLTSDSSASISTGTFFQNGIYQEFFLSAPQGNKQGSFNLEYQVPVWLQFDWDGDSLHDNNPFATATFGVFRGNDRIIYTREVFN
ncbi:DUF6701 domain-containing protein [Pseudocolwellia sp. AS88]|uniref:DUF6701 domain-containing protein n=1 Tax=Pseudocolwellia sp. AS88 TaxID=3063958 RepID=UPI0026E92A73|nr:DUF6701 domain-containing protein [Pseudocolwellia sp. AS88]MDO7085795.1 hypothetical protein [Pseudocolwellia sp. AS88]